MTSPVDGLQIRYIHRRVDLRGGHGGVAQHRLDVPKIGPALQKVGGKRVPERVGRDGIGNPGDPGVFPDRMDNAQWLQGPTALGDEKGRFGESPPGSKKLWPSLG